jgi:hypothetical protein
LFKHIFDQVYGKNRDVLFIGIWGKDGIELEKAIYKSDFPDTDLLGAEVANIVSKMDQGYIVEGQKESYRIVAFALNRSYFLLVGIKETGIIGKLKFHISIAKKQIVSLL